MYAVKCGRRGSGRVGVQPIYFHICNPTWDLVPLVGNVYFLVSELYFLVVKTIRKYSF